MHPRWSGRIGAEQDNIRGFGPFLVRRDLEDWIRTLAATDDVSQERKNARTGKSSYWETAVISVTAASQAKAEAN